MFQAIGKTAKGNFVFGFTFDDQTSFSKSSSMLGIKNIRRVPQANIRKWTDGFWKDIKQVPYKEFRKGDFDQLISE